MVIRSFRPGDERFLSTLVSTVFMRYIAPDYSREGIDEFLKYVRENDILERVIEGNHYIYIALQGRTVVGVIEIREYRHISLFFVNGKYHRRGIGSLLMKNALELCRVMNPILLRLSVNSSPFAVPVYEKLGFHIEADEMEKNGIRFTPMSYLL
ncbi:MAG TPA: GNAT family N-acetyltransferase [Spirochaetota bacterium]|nr:GNAT family N-acetyltransferase [Spirochaetota bacterium]HPQ52702.1 GNAT family N-acetyltransferase [Spirochaetota bacterium]